MAAGCSLLEKEFAGGSATDINTDGDGLSSQDTSDSGIDGRPGGDGTDPGDEGGDDAGSGGDAGSGEGSDGGSGSGGESGSGGDTGESSRVDCTPGAVASIGNIDECVSSTMSCGSSTIATTQGGNMVMNADDYLNWYCTPFPEGDYDGPERTFNVTVPAGLTATFSLESPCEELDIFALRWELWMTDEMCPEYNNSVLECEADDSRADGTISVTADPTRDTNYLVIIDGPEGQQQPFALDIDCAE
jgi:hypothetical protein